MFFCFKVYFDGGEKWVNLFGFIRGWRGVSFLSNR